jgi:hypothetical protein
MKPPITYSFEARAQTTPHVQCGSIRCHCTLQREGMPRGTQGRQCDVLLLRRETGAIPRRFLAMTRPEHSQHGTSDCSDTRHHSTRGRFRKKAGSVASSAGNINGLQHNHIRSRQVDEHHTQSFWDQREKLRALEGEVGVWSPVGAQINHHCSLARVSPPSWPTRLCARKASTLLQNRAFAGGAIE